MKLHIVILVGYLASMPCCLILPHGGLSHRAGLLKNRPSPQLPGKDEPVDVQLRMVMYEVQSLLVGTRAINVQGFEPMKRGREMAEGAVNWLDRFIGSKAAAAFQNNAKGWQPKVEMLTRGATLMWKTVLEARKFRDGFPEEKRLLGKISALKDSEEKSNLEKKVKAYYSFTQDEILKLNYLNDGLIAPSIWVVKTMDRSPEAKSYFRQIKGQIQLEYDSFAHYKIYDSKSEEVQDGPL